MKINKALLLAPLAVFAVSSTSSLMAQTCSAPVTLTSNQPTATFNNCDAAGGGTGDTTIGTVCSSNDVTGGVHVFKWTHGSGTTSGSITVTPTAPYNAAIFVGEGADCSTAAGGFCDQTSDGAGQTAESADLTTLNAANTTYFLFVASTAAGTARCGAYTLAVGTLPVTLETFKVN